MNPALTSSPSEAISEKEISHTESTVSTANGEKAKNSSFFEESQDNASIGTHLIIDMWGAHKLRDSKYIEQTMKNCVNAAGATLLHYHTHKFNLNGGISGLAILAESHISIHTWPEMNYAAFDIFTCGSAKPSNVIAVLEEAFKPDKINFITHLRGSRD